MPHRAPSPSAPAPSAGLRMPRFSVLLFRNRSLQDFQARRTDEYQQRFRVALPDREPPLDIDIKEDMSPAFQHPVDFLLQCAVVISVDLFPLDELTCVDPAAEFLRRQKEIFSSLAVLPPAWGASSRRSKTAVVGWAWRIARAIVDLPAPLGAEITTSLPRPMSVIRCSAAVRGSSPAPPSCSRRGARSPSHSISIRWYSLPGSFPG